MVDIAAVTAAGASGTGVTVPIDGSREEGDRLLLVAARLGAMSVSAGWTEVGRQSASESVPGGPPATLVAYQRPSDGTEAQVTISGPSDVYAGIVLVVKAARPEVEIATSATSSLATTFSPPGLDAAQSVEFALFDGANVDNRAEAITSVAGDLLVNLNPTLNGLPIFGFAATAGPGDFTCDGTDSSTRWVGITLGLGSAGAPALRGRQRGDAFGSSTAPRGRQVGSRQASLRGRAFL